MVVLLEMEQQHFDFRAPLSVPVFVILWFGLISRGKDTWDQVGVCPSSFKDYLVVKRKWLGLVGRGGLIPRESAACVGVSALKVFISSATRPRPAQAGAVPDAPASAEPGCRHTAASKPAKRRNDVSWRSPNIHRLMRGSVFNGIYGTVASVCL